MFKPSTEELLDKAFKAAVMAFEIPKEWLPEAYRGKRKTRKLISVVKQAQRRKKNIFKDKRAVRNSPERLAVIEAYAKQIEAGQPIEFQVNERRQNNVAIAFCEGAERMEARMAEREAQND